MFKDSETKVSTYGDVISRFGIPHLTYRREELGNIPESQEIAYLGGGCNLAKREFYEKVGLQDENLFMYNDEMDMYFRGVHGSRYKTCQSMALPYIQQSK